MVGNGPRCCVVGPLLNSGTAVSWQPQDQEAIRQALALPATVPCLMRLHLSISNCWRPALSRSTQSRNSPPPGRSLVRLPPAAMLRCRRDRLRDRPAEGLSVCSDFPAPPNFPGWSLNLICLQRLLTRPETACSSCSHPACKHLASQVSRADCAAEPIDTGWMPLHRLMPNLIVI